MQIDGAMGEGGGQILRSSLGLSLLTGTPIRIENIRAARKKPGLMRQHLTCVRAATAVGQAEVVGDEIGSKTLEFRPRAVTGGHYEFAIGGAGSTILVIQTVLPALLRAPEASSLVVRGGTHNPMAPPFEFFDRVFLPVLRRMGAKVEARLARHGFMPAGGGAVMVEIEPVQELRRLDLLERGEIEERRGRILHSKIHPDVATREKATILKKLRWSDEAVHCEQVGDSPGPGNVVMLEVSDGTNRELVTGHAERGTLAERVAEAAVRQMKRYLDLGAPVGVHLADQLLIPMAMAGGGSFETRRPSLHTTTNAEVVGKFLDVAIEFEDLERGITRVTI